jgi:aerotaxis receptor
MRINHPITQREYSFPEQATLMSTTDVRGKIVYANEAFIGVSGYTREELVDQPHNIVRHPDMPEKAFADMWATLKAGKLWTGLVKNRRKNGDHYWVRANAAPLRRNGQTIGYMSVRTAPAKQDVAHAEALYKKINQKQAPHLALKQGVVVHQGWRACFSLHKTLSIRHRIRLLLAAALPIPLVIEMGMGVSGTALLGSAASFAAMLVIVGWLLEQQIARPIEQICAEAIKVATGESTSTTHLQRTDEIGMTMRCIGQLGLMFRWVIDDVAEQVKHVQNGVSEIAQGNDDLSNRTEQAASSVQQTASSLMEMDSTVQSNVATSKHANELSGSASEAASNGGHAVSQVIATMEGITQSSKKIADIIGVIDSIAFQTNILALNAAVEAARAGEQGRGFAVVATEVRNLAQRSAEAAKEIKDLIHTSSDKVAEGSTLVSQAGQAMDDIVKRVNNVTSLIGEISSATSEQASGISQVGQAINELDKITQQNAALCEETAAASGSLRQQANRLAEAVRVFS